MASKLQRGRSVITLEIDVSFHVNEETFTIRVTLRARFTVILGGRLRFELRVRLSLQSGNLNKKK